MHIIIFIPYDTPTFKTEVYRLASIEGQAKRLAVILTADIQPYLSLLWLLLTTHFVSRATPINDIDGKTHKM